MLNNQRTKGRVPQLRQLWQLSSTQRPLYNGVSSIHSFMSIKQRPISNQMSVTWCTGRPTQLELLRWESMRWICIWCRSLSPELRTAPLPTSLVTYRIHVWYIYANIGGILMVNVTIYSITMDPMGYTTSLVGCWRYNLSSSWQVPCREWITVPDQPSFQRTWSMFDLKR